MRQSLQELVEMEYLEIMSGCNGRAYQYRLLVEDPSQFSPAMRDLTTPEELERLWKAASG